MTVVAVLDLAVLGGSIVAAAVKDDGSKHAAVTVPAVAPTSSAPTSAAPSSAPVSSTAPAPTSAAVPPPVSQVPVAPGSAATSTAPPVGAVTVSTKAPATHHPSSTKPKPSSSANATVGAKPGSYPETATGTVKIGGSSSPADGTATLTVSPPQGTDQEQANKSQQSSTDEIARFGADGSVRLTFLHISSAAFDDSFHFATPELILPAKPVAGTTYSWSAKSDDGKTTIDYKGTVKGTENVTIGGTVVHCIVVQSSFTLSGGTNVSVTQTDDYAAAYRLVVREHQVASGKAFGLPFTADITTTLTRLTPQ